MKYTTVITTTVSLYINDDLSTIVVSYVMLIIQTLASRDEQ